MFNRTLIRSIGGKCNFCRDDPRNQTIQERLASDSAAAALISVALARGVARKPYAVAPFNAENGRVCTFVLDVVYAFQVTRIQVECCRDERFPNARRVNPPKFLTELKGRNVYRAAVAYGVVASFLTQLTTQVFPFFEIPNSAVHFVVMALGKNSAKSNRSKSHAIRAFRRREIRDWHVLVIDIRWLVLPELVMM